MLARICLIPDLKVHTNSARAQEDLGFAILSLLFSLQVSVAI